MSGSKRGPAAAVLANPQVQEAAIEKGIEVAGKLIDKQLQNIDDAQQKAADFLKKEVSIVKVFKCTVKLIKSRHPANLF